MISRRRYARLGDADLVVLIAQGDDHAFREVLQRHQDAVYRFARRMLEKDQDAEDISQETFLRLYRVSNRYRPVATLRTFLLKMAKNLCIDHHRKKRPELMAQIPEIATQATPLDLLEGAIETDRLEKAIQRLPANQRAVLLLRHNENLRYRQIAEVMDLSVGAVESLLVRARRTLRCNLAAEK